MILVKGHSVVFDLEPVKPGWPERSIECRRSRGMMHDEQGADWPKDSVLVGPYEKTGREVDGGGAGRAYFGSDYRTRAATVVLPERALRGWKKLGIVKTVWYVRTGKRAPGPFRHAFGKGWDTFFIGASRPVLYQKGRYYRIELGAGSVVDDRGFVRP